MKYTLILFLLLFASLNIFAANNQENSDSIELELNKRIVREQYDSTTHEFFYFDVPKYRFVDISKAMDYSNKQLQMSHLSRDYNIKADAYARLAHLYLNLGLTEKSIDFLQKAEKEFPPQKQKYAYSWVLVNIGNAYYSYGFYESAIRYFTWARNNFDAIKKDHGFMVSTNNIGLSYRGMKKYDSAMYYFRSVLNISKNDFIQSVLTYKYIANTFSLQNQNDSAKYYYDKVLTYYNTKDSSLYDKVNNDVALVEVLLEVGLFNQKIKKYDSAAYYLNLAHRTTIAENLQQFVPECELALGNLNIELNDYKSAIQNYLRGLELAEKINLVRLKAQIYDKLSNAYALTNDFQNAYKFNKKYLELRDSIYNVNFTKYISDIDVKISTINNESKIEALEKEKKYNALQVSQQRNIIISLYLFSILGAITTFLLYNRYRYKRQSANILSKMNESLEESNYKLMNSEKDLKELNATKDRFFSIIAHDLKNPISVLISSTSLLSNPSYHLDKEDMTEFMQAINKSAKNLFNLLENLLKWARVQNGTIPFAPEENSIYETLNRILYEMQPLISAKELNLKHQIPVDLIALYDEAMFSSIIRNLLSNAIKFTKRGGNIEIIAVSDNDKLKVSVTDDGIGISGEIQKRLFNIDKGVAALGTENEEGSGLGLILCKEFASKHNGTIEIQSYLSKGSKFTLVLPIKN